MVRALVDMEKQQTGLSWSSMLLLIHSASLWNYIYVEIWKSGDDGSSQYWCARPHSFSCDQSSMPCLYLFICQYSNHFYYNYQVFYLISWVLVFFSYLLWPKQQQDTFLVFEGTYQDAVTLLSLHFRAYFFRHWLVTPVLMQRRLVHQWKVIHSFIPHPGWFMSKPLWREVCFGLAFPPLSHGGHHELLTSGCYVMTMMVTLLVGSWRNPLSWEARVKKWRRSWERAQVKVEPAVNLTSVALLFHRLFSPSALTGSPQYSDDFEEGDSVKEGQVCRTFY